MSKVHKVSMFITDIDGDNDIEDLIKHCLNSYDLFPECIEVKSSEEFKWDDDLVINKINSTKEDFEKYFK
jgi:hypothetical protein